MGLFPTKFCIIALTLLVFSAFSPILGSAFGQESEVINRSVFAWNLFYELMTAAIVVGVIVQGTLIYIIFRFREKKIKHEEVSG